jgi:hypothetical protein
MFNIFSTDFNQSSACRGSGELAKVGGLWLINSRCLSRGGSGGGASGASGACCCCTLLSWHISSLSLGASLDVPAASMRAYPP